MIMIATIVLVLFYAGVGVVGGIILVTPVIALMNYLATDGPYFSPFFKTYP
jgi:hypothetical protein